MIAVLVTLGYAAVTFFIGIITAAVIYARWHYGTLEGVKGLPVVIKPAFMGGSDPYIYKKVVHDQDTENVKKHGKVFGYYNGRTPTIYIADPELIRLVLVKDFDHFQDKPAFDIGHEIAMESIDFLPYEKWKVVRQAFSPNLSTGKIKNMSIIMGECVDTWLEEINKKVKGDTVFLSKIEYNALLLDIIARCGFGTKMNALDDPENPFVKHAASLISAGEGEPNFLLTVALTFPFLSKFVPILSPTAIEYFANVINGVMASRRTNNIKLGDFVDTLNEMHEKIPTEEYKRLRIREDTVTAQALAFFIAGYETTSATLSFLSYLLVKYPEVQDKVIKEVDDYLARHGGNVEHETLGELVYLSACFQETLRIFPSLIRIERKCTKEWRHESGLVIPEGMIVEIPVFSLHEDPEYFPDPHIFKPERFLPENKDNLNPYSYLPFGLGNHNCIGMRMSKENSLIAMVKILKIFKFRAAANTNIVVKKGSTFAFQTEPFSVEAVKRA